MTDFKSPLIPYLLTRIHPTGPSFSFINQSVSSRPKGSSIIQEMFGAYAQRDISQELETQKQYYKSIRNSRKANISVKFQDLYGFNVEGNVDDVNVLNEVRERVRQQGRLWWELEANKGANWYLQPQISSVSGGIAVASLKFSSVANSILLKRLVRKGIPPVLRPKVWFFLSGAAKKRSTVPESYYEDLINAVEGKVTPATRQIDHDLPRTFPGHPWLDTPEGHASLRRVLVVYSFRDSDVGYCQGLNYVAALLLLVMKTEEDAFWMLAVLLENVLVNDCYTDNLSGCHVEQRVFKDFLAQKCPRIATHLEALKFDVSLVATEWFLCLFSKSLPSEVGIQNKLMSFFPFVCLILIQGYTYHVILPVVCMKPMYFP